MNKHVRLFAATAILAVLLSGCMYPGAGADRTGGGVSTGEYIVLVENAVDTYKNRTGVLPIMNSQEDTPILEKYRIDFGQLLDYRVISRIPPDAYEEGGYYYYMIVDPEGDPQVKLLDLRVSQAAADVQRLVDNYVLTEGKLPLGEPAGEGLHILDFAKLGTKQRQARSVYSGNYLVYLIHESGKVAIDYGPDIMHVAGNGGESRPNGDEDLRYRLIANSPYIPIASYPYYWTNGMPVVSDRES